MNNDILKWVQVWYLQQCDGDWEHDCGIKVDTLDNPGWQVCIDLEGTDLENRIFDPVTTEHSDDDWIHCVIQDCKFVGHGGPCNLLDILATFRDWAVTA